VQHTPAILVVEDDKHIAAMIALLIEDAGYRAVLAHSASAAQAHLDAEAFDLVILDWMLPDLPGVQLCRTIKARGHNSFLPILMLTARADLADRITGLDAGADDYLTKPFDTEELMARVRALLRIRTAEMERSAALDALARQHAELRDAYEKLRSAQFQLVQVSKLASLGALVAGVAHELNNPLAIIMGNIELLPELPDPEDRQAIGQIVIGAQRIQRVVRSLATFAQYHGIQRLLHHPCTLVEHVLDVRREALRAVGIGLEVFCESNLPMLWADGQQIQQVLLNLLLNAEYALKKQEHPRIVIRLFHATTAQGPPDLLPAPELVSHADGGQEALVIDVADNGPGLPDTVRERLFEPFVTTRPIGQGIGMGLATAYGIVAQHGGSMSATTELGRGTTFRIILPYSPAR
jgi:signal transduction histidine kinase